MDGLRIGYLASIYPRAVDTAVRNEVLLLRDRGCEVDTFSIRRADGSQLVSELHEREHANTIYILSDHLLRLPLAALAVFFRSPSRFLRGFRLAMQTRPAGWKGWVWQTAYFLEAAFLAKQMLERGIRHLHVHIGENSASVAMLASEISDVPYSMTIHGPYIFRAPERWALSEKILRSAFTVCITEFTKSQCMIFVPHSEWDRFVVIRCGPEPGFLSVEPPRFPDRARMVWVGRICEEKAVPILLAAVHRLAEEGLDFELAMVGDGPLRAEVESQIESLGLGDRITITGWLALDQVREQISASRLMVLPSFAEGLPAVIMEAMALGRPVISTYIAGIPELVRPGKNGWLVAAGSAEDLVRAMREALESPLEHLERLGEAGRKAVLELHDARVEVGKLAELIERSAKIGKRS